MCLRALWKIYFWRSTVRVYIQKLIQFRGKLLLLCKLMKFIEFNIVLVSFSWWIFKFIYWEVCSFLKFKDEINAYSNLPLFEPVKDVLNFRKNDHQGKQFPKLRRLVQKILGACASSVASDSTFSTRGNIVDKKRTKLMGENVEALTFIHYMLLMED